MITRADDSLTIFHEDRSRHILTALAAMADRYGEEWLPRLRQQDLTGTLEKLLQGEFTSLTDHSKAEARAAVPRLGWLEERFRRMVREHIEVKEERPAHTGISFQRTLRIPDDGKTYPLPPGLGNFPIRRLEDCRDRLPVEFRVVSGVLVPMHQAEALWLSFESNWPTALKIGTGTVNAINGRKWEQGLTAPPQQGYVVLPEQPWLDGFCVAPGVVRQFIATRLGRGYSAEEQVLGSTRGGLQIEAFPLRPEAYFEKSLREELPRTVEAPLRNYLQELPGDRVWDGLICSRSFACAPAPMGLGAGGRIKQQIYQDQWEPGDWDLSRPSRLWVHLLDAATWRALTGELPPHAPPTAAEYARHGFPWFDYYRDDMEALSGTAALARLRTVFALAAENDDASIPQPGSVSAVPIAAIGPDAPVAKVSQWDGK